MQTLAALDAWFAALINDNGTLLSQLAIAGGGLLLAWVTARRAKMRAAAEGAVAEVEALTQPSRLIFGAEKHREATQRLAERLGKKVHVKLGNEVQAAFERLKSRGSLPPSPSLFPEDDVSTIPERPAAKRPKLE